MSRDPLGFDGGDGNLYGYVGNEPVLGVDASGFVSLGGLFQCDVIQCFDDIIKNHGGGKGRILLKTWQYASFQIAYCALQYHIDPIILLSVAWCESHFGSDNNNDPRYVHNPFNCHFCPKAKGLDKLNQCDGSFPTLEESACCAARTISREHGVTAGSWNKTVGCSSTQKRVFSNICPEATLYPGIWEGIF